GLDALPPSLRRKARVIVQSARLPHRGSRRRREVFEACVLAHLRMVKDPLLAAGASRMLPPASRVRILHAGAALDPAMAPRARARMLARPDTDAGFYRGPRGRCGRLRPRVAPRRERESWAALLRELEPSGAVPRAAPGRRSAGPSVWGPAAARRSGR